MLVFGNICSSNWNYISGSRQPRVARWVSGKASIVLLISKRLQEAMLWTTPHVTTCFMPDFLPRLSSGVNFEKFIFSNFQVLNLRGGENQR